MRIGWDLEVGCPYSAPCPTQMFTVFEDQAQILGSFESLLLRSPAGVAHHRGPGVRTWSGDHESFGQACEGTMDTRREPYPHPSLFWLDRMRSQRGTYESLRFKDSLLFDGHILQYLS